MITLQSIQIWSKAQNQLADWTITVVDDTTFESATNDSLPKVVVARCGEEELRFSPNFTDDELTKLIAEYNLQKGI